MHHDLWRNQALYKLKVKKNEFSVVAGYFDIACDYTAGAQVLVVCEVTVEMDTTAAVTFEDATANDRV